MSSPSATPRELINEAVPNAPFYQPLTEPAPGTPLSSEDWSQNKDLPLLFQPVKIGPLTLKNRILVSPMCMYSSPSTGPETGTLTPFHLVHLGAFAIRGAALVCVEATSVLPNGRLTPQDSGLWNDTQRDALKPIFEFIKMQGAVPGIQLGHAGRKASALAPWLDTSTIKPPLASHIATNGEAGGWTDDVIAPSAIAHEDDTYPLPREMTEKDFADLRQAYVDATRRADEAGAEFLEFHTAHGYLGSNILSPLSNHRTDKYGGSLENRLRFLLELLSLVRENWPKSKALALRLNATEWHPEGEKNEKGEYISWGIEQAKIFVKEAIARGVDLIDVSSGGNDKNQKIDVGPGYQSQYSEEIRNSLSPEEREKVVVSAVGLITNGKQAEATLQDGQSDVVFVGREFLRHADLVADWAQELGTVVNVPVEYQLAHRRMFTKPEEKKPSRSETKAEEEEGAETK